MSNIRIHYHGGGERKWVPVDKVMEIEATICRGTTKNWRKKWHMNIVYFLKIIVEFYTYRLCIIYTTVLFFPFW